MSNLRVYRSKEYKDWHNSLDEKDQGIVDSRIDTYIEYGKLIRSKSLDPNFGLYEFKWDSGLRIYFSFLEDNDGRLMLLLLGGNKNSQSKDITRAKKIVSRAVNKIAEKKEKK